jgi:catechol 2,3-dioxygenase-like lactoylglutathione lyase family enzyme
MPRGLDHIVHAVRDLDEAAEFYRRAGFKVGARNKHPWGTHNHVVQFPRFFIEILTVAEPEKLVGEGLPQIFGVANRDAITRGDGFSMLLLESADSEADVADFNRIGISASPSLPFSREARLPDGSTTTVGFSLAFARDALSPHTGFATCQQQNPSAFWKADYQQHPNGASGVLGAVLVADNPTDHHIFLSGYTGVRELHSSSMGVVAPTPRGDIEIIEAIAFRDQFGITPKMDGEGAVLKALRLSVASIDAVQQQLRKTGIVSHRHIGRLIVPPEAAFGATLIFEATNT